LSLTFGIILDLVREWISNAPLSCLLSKPEISHFSLDASCKFISAPFISNLDILIQRWHLGERNNLATLFGHTWLNYMYYYVCPNDISIANSWLAYCPHKIERISHSWNLEKDFWLLQQHTVTHSN
jgi:hypothetical protein